MRRGRPSFCQVITLTDERRPHHGEVEACASVYYSGPMVPESIGPRAAGRAVRARPRSARQPLPAEPASEQAARIAIAGARPFIEELLSLWPADRRHGLVISVKLGHAGAIEISACLRERHEEGGSRELKNDVRRIRDDVPVVLEFGDRRTVVPLRAFR